MLIILNFGSLTPHRKGTDFLMNSEKERRVKLKTGLDLTNLYYGFNNNGTYKMLFTVD